MMKISETKSQDFSVLDEMVSLNRKEGSGGPMILFDVYN